MQLKIFREGLKPSCFSEMVAHRPAAVQYVKFMTEYKKRGHMTEMDLENLPTSNYFIPHHSVLRPKSTSMK